MHVSGVQRWIECKKRNEGCFTKENDHFSYVFYWCIQNKSMDVLPPTFFYANFFPYKYANDKLMRNEIVSSFFAVET